MQIWEMETSLDKTKRAPIVLLSLEEKAREAILELDTAVLNSEDGMKNLYEKLDTLFSYTECCSLNSLYLDHIFLFIYDCVKLCQ